jgi:hypothetical protein
MTGNQVAVDAFGNSAQNTLTLSGLNSGNATNALQNAQSNTGNVTATASYNAFGATTTAPGAIGSTVNVGNNSIIARATGNSAINTVVAH